MPVLIASLKDLDEKITLLDREIAKRAREDQVARRLTTIPGIGPIIATAIAALAPPVETFKRGRDFAAWAGLMPLQRSTGSKQKLGATSKWASGQSAGCSSSARAPWYVRPFVVAHPKDLGSRACSSLAP